MLERVVARLPVPLYALPHRRIVSERPDLRELIDRRVAPPIDVVRPDDLLHLSFSFVNLVLEQGQ